MSATLQTADTIKTPFFTTIAIFYGNILCNPFAITINGLSLPLKHSKMVNNSQITINATTFLVNVGWLTTEARKTVTILVNDTSASFYIIICRYFTTRERGIFHNR